MVNAVEDGLMANVLGERLRTARRLRRWTQEQLAHVSGGVTKAAVSAWETGKRMPDAGTLRRLAKALDLPGPGWLLQAPECSVQWLGFRARSRMPQAHREWVQATAERAVAAWWILTELVGVSLPSGLSEPREVATFDEVEAAAEVLRAQWVQPVAPLPGLTAMVEASGIVLIALDDGPDGEDLDAFDGLSGTMAMTSQHKSSSEIPDRVPVVVIRARQPADRLRLSLAHELGHWFVRRAPGALADQHRPDEAMAFRFGAALLVPAERARAEDGFHG